MKVSKFWGKLLFGCCLPLPNDIDITIITSDRYSALMDLGRLDCVIRCGLRNVMVKHKWIPIASFQTLRFRYPIKIFQKYQLKTKVIWWDDTTFYWEHTFERKGRIVATGHVCATRINKNGIVSSKEIIATVGPGDLSPTKFFADRGAGHEVVVIYRECSVTKHLQKNLLTCKVNFLI